MIHSSQIGDYILYDKTEDKVVAVHKDYVLLENKPEDSKIPFSDLEGIPITVESLQKYGFEEIQQVMFMCSRYNIGDTNHPKWVVRLKRFKKTTLWFLEIFAHHATIMTKNTSIAHVRYLHEVQQAMRLTEINEELTKL